MEVLLLQDINGIGKKNDLLVVGDGFALNYLLPRRAALVATPLVRRRYAEMIRNRAEEREQEKQAQTEVAKAVAGKSVMFQRKATKAGKLYAGITEDNIAEALKEQHGLEVGVEAIQLTEHIKNTGSYPVNVVLAGQSHTVSVVVKADGAAKTEGKKRAA